MNEIRVLLVDDDEDDYIIARDLLDDIHYNEFKLKWVDNYDDALVEALSGKFDVCLFDYRLGKKTGLQLLSEVVEKGCQLPIILLTGQGDREVDVEAMKAGAADFLAKGQLNAPLLERSIRYSIERSQTEQKLAHLAQYDALTGLPNRLFFNDRLRQAIALAGRESCLVGLLFLDLDRFKIINDSLGHAAGDILLKEVSRRLNKCVRDCDTVSRLGGDEFVVILSALGDTKGASMVAGRIVDSISPAIKIESEEVFVSASVGIGFFPFDGQDAETLIKSADTAMYRAKSDGGNCYRFFSKDINGHLKNRLALESGLHRALEREEFRLDYLPLFDVATGKVTALEALLRWQPKDGDLVPPDEFIPLLNDTGMINVVGEWVLKTAGRQLKAIHDEGFEQIRLSVNFSSRQLRQEGVDDMIARVLAETSIRPEFLDLELNEDSLMHHFQENIAIFQRLTDIGVKLSLDDFGTGYSSLSSLKFFPIARLKIDRTFVGNICTDNGDAAISKAIISLAHSLDMRVSAEGVEEKCQFDFLQQNGCDEAQGKYFSGPLSPDKVLDFLRKTC